MNTVLETFKILTLQKQNSPFLGVGSIKKLIGKNPAVSDTVSMRDGSLEVYFIGQNICNSIFFPILC